jgi:hypothetical protein
MSLQVSCCTEYQKRHLQMNITPKLLFRFIEVRTCWGREDRHTETLRWFLDNGIPVDDLYDICMMSSSNEKTKALLKERKEKKDEL